MIFFYSGSDTYRLRQAVSAVLAHAPKGTMTISVDMRTPEGREECERALKYPSFFKEISYVIAQHVGADVDTAKSCQQLCERYGVASFPDVVLIACHTDTDKKESAAVKSLRISLSKHAKETAFFEPLQGSELKKWVQQQVADRKGTIQLDATMLLIERTAGDSWALAQELEKLCAYAHEITQETVALLTPAHQEYDDFQLARALERGNKRAALTALWSALSQGTSEHLLAGIAAYAFRKNMPTGQAGLIALARLDRDAKRGHIDMTDGLYALILDL